MDASGVLERCTDGRNGSAAQFLDRERLHLISCLDLNAILDPVWVESSVK
jgi:hypothetical protein